MANLSTVYSLAGSTTINFNSGTLGSGSLNDLYWLSSIRGLDGPTLRTQVDDLPYGDGGLIHKFWKGPRRPVFEGALIVQSVPFGSSGCQDALDVLEAALNACLDSMIQTTGTLSWTSSVSGPLSLPVVYEVGLDIQPSENYALRTFTFGLVSAQADPS